MRFAPLAVSGMLVVFAAISAAQVSVAANSSTATFSVDPPPKGAAAAVPMVRRSFADAPFRSLSSVAKYTKQASWKSVKEISMRTKSLSGKFPRTTSFVRSLGSQNGEAKVGRKVVTGVVTRLPNQLGSAGAPSGATAASPAAAGVSGADVV